MKKILFLFNHLKNIFKKLIPPKPSDEEKNRKKSVLKIILIFFIFSFLIISLIKFTNYASYFNGIHLAFALVGNDNRVEYTVYIQRNRFEERWDKLTDSTLKNFMKKLCSEINNEFRECHVLGCVFDIDGYNELACCEQVPQGEFTFSREQ